jgi:beta-lactamase superfamily II metal-dependent hydrolase
VRNFTVNTALVGRTPANDPEFTKFSGSIANTNLETVHAGDLIRLGKSRYVFSGRRRERIRPTTIRRAQSTVSHRSILLTGDVEKKAESELTAAVRSEADV